MKLIVNYHRKKYAYLIGIDTGVSTGFCVWSHFEKRIIQLDTVKIHTAMESVKFWHETNPGEVLVRVEDARKATYGRKQDAYKAQGAGSVMRDARIWEDYLEDLGVDYELVRPDNRVTKWDADTFKKATGYSGQTSNHARDSCLMVYGL